MYPSVSACLSTSVCLLYCVCMTACRLLNLLLLSLSTCLSTSVCYLSVSLFPSHVVGGSVSLRCFSWTVCVSACACLCVRLCAGPCLSFILVTFLPSPFSCTVCVAVCVSVRDYPPSVPSSSCLSKSNTLPQSLCSLGHLPSAPLPSSVTVVVLVDCVSASVVCYSD